VIANWSSSVNAFRRIFHRVHGTCVELNVIAFFFSFFPQMAGQIDMNMQSDLMAAFEESL